MERMDPLPASFDSQIHQYKRDKSRLISNAMKASFSMSQNHDRLLPEQLVDIYHEGTMPVVMMRSSPTTALSNQPRRHQEKDEETIGSGLEDGSEKRSGDDGEATVA
ncbi:hypothetical protein EDD11_008589 [Mortierella claussenii]|nr:hypothetical protein EDD11_008589 [Mortierella claussenii]